MQPITAGQVRAARALLDWTREELVQESGVSLTTIKNIEKGSSARKSTLVDLRNALENAGICFQSDGGLHRERADVKVISGALSCQDFFYLMSATLKRTAGELMGVFTEQKLLFDAFGSENLNYLSRNGDLKFLISDKSKVLQPMPQAALRTVSKYCACPSSFFIFGNKYAIVQRDTAGDLRFIVFNDAGIATAFKEHFHMLWNISAPLLAFSKKDTSPKTLPM